MVAVATSCALAASVSAAEPVDEFLAALRRNGYHDMAVEYLQRVAKSPSVDDDFKRRYRYELGAVLLDAARTAGDPLARDQLAEQGLEHLRQFVASNPQHTFAAAATSMIAEASLEQGRALLARAKRSRDPDRLREQARAAFTEAAKSFEAVEKQRLAEFESQAPTADRQQRNQLGGPILEARLRIAEAQSDVAKTYEPGSPEANRALKQGIDRYAALYDKYASDGFVAAYAARVREAGNYLQLGKAEEALSRVKDVLDEVDQRNEALRDLVLTPGYLAALKAWHHQGDFKSPIEIAAAYAASASASESKRPDWLEMQYLLALAYQQHAQSLKPGDPQRTKYESEARKLAGQIVKHRSDVQNDARLLLGKLGRPVESSGGDAKTFAEALEKTTAAIQDYTAAKLARATPQGNDRAATERLNQQVIEARDAARRAAQHTLSLADDESDLAKLNIVRFYLCYLHWEYGPAESAQNKLSSRYFDAAVLGDFLARTFPDHPNARQAMAIAIASYQKIRQDVVQDAQQAAEQAGKEADEVRAAIDAAAAVWSKKLSQLAEYAIAKWPDADEAASAMAILASLAIERQDFDAARQLVEKLKPGSASRADAELRLGRAIWSNYVRAKKSRDDRISDQTLRQWAKQAQALLEAGLKTSQTHDEIDRSAVLGLWALVQLYVSTSQPEKAIAWLEDEKLGLLTLVNDKHEAAEIEGLLFDAYRLALRAYIAATPQQLDKALATMDALEKITGSDAKGREMLTTVYIAMGRDLQQEIEDFAAMGNSEQVAALSTAFEAFLQRLVGRESGNTFNSLFWVADTYVELGAGLAKAAEDSASDRKRGQRYYRQAVAALESILKRDQADAEFMPDKYLPLVQTRLAKAYRGAGEYAAALTLLTAILKEKPNVLDVQFDAAYTFQEFADSDPAKYSKHYRHAVLGGQSDKDRSVWGWNSLAAKIRAQQERLRRETEVAGSAQKAEQYRERYHEARFNSVYCTVALAKLATNSAEKERLLKVAKQGIWSVYAIVDSQLGGGQWKARNDRLLRDVQRALGEPEIGLQEFEQRKQQQAQTTLTK